MTYPEYLQSLGASPEDIKALTEGPGSATARKAFETAQAQIAESERVRAAAQADREKLQTYFDTQLTPAYGEMERKVVVAQANEARAREALLSAQRQGLLDVAKDLGYDPAPGADGGGQKGTPSPNPGAPGFDPNRYFTRDDILQIAEKEGEAIAAAQDIAYEHRVLFPDKPLNFRQLRAEARDRKIPVERLWEERFGVPAAREARTRQERDAEIAKWQAEGAKKREEELVSKWGNPDSRPLVPSTSPLTPRPVGGRDKQPWDAPNDTALSNDRVTRATQKVIKTFSGQGN